jgi:hypothetical protein
MTGVVMTSLDGKMKWFGALTVEELRDLQKRLEGREKIRPLGCFL